jgi:hypothetical protein
MSEASVSSKVMGFVASENSLCDELAVAARHCATSGLMLAVSSSDAIRQTAYLQAEMPQLSTIVDTRHWSSHLASPQEPTEISNMLIDLDWWAETAIQTSGGRWVLAPTGFVKLGDNAALAAVLNETANASHPALVTFVATDAEMLSTRHIHGFLDVLEQTPRRQFAFVFADKAKPLANYQRLKGLRTLLSRFPGSYILGLDVPAGTDAIAHGAGWIGIGASSSRRWPCRPGDPGGGPLAAGYLPGFFLRELLEMRSPAIYSDWYANSRSPICRTCRRPLESYRPTSPDKALIITHNMHEIHDFVLELTARAPADQPVWLDQERIKALIRHTKLTSTGALVEADLTLRRLCELDDPQMRETTRTGAWQ